MSQLRTNEYHDAEEMARLEALVRDLAQALLPYRMEHSKNNCYYAGDAGPVCDECQATDAALSKIPKEMTSHD